MAAPGQLTFDSFGTMRIAFQSNGDFKLTATDLQDLTGKWKALSEAPPQGFKGVVELGPAEGDVNSRRPERCAYKIEGARLYFANCGIPNLEFIKE